MSKALSRLTIVVSLAALFALASAKWRSLRVQADANTCVLSLRVLDDAKERWARENNKKAGDEVYESDIRSYFKGGVLPSCEVDGKYTIGVVGERPKCSMPGHVLGP
jgi:hypothetical protein